MIRTEEAGDLVRDQAARFAGQNVHLGLLGRGPVDAANLRTWLIELARGGWAGLYLAEEANGSGLSTYDLCTVAEEFGRKLLPIYVPLAAVVPILDTAPASAALREPVLAGRALIVPALQSEGRWPSSGHGIRADADERGGYALTGSQSCRAGCGRGEWLRGRCASRTTALPCSSSRAMRAV